MTLEHLVTLVVYSVLFSGGATLLIIGGWMAYSVCKARRS